jgi:amino acid adenylation domain-containing protein
LLDYRHAAAAGQKPADVFMWPGMRAVLTEQRTNYPISVLVDDEGQGFSLTAQCIRGIGPGRMTTYLQNALDALSTALADGSQHPLLSLPILPASERHRLLVEWNNTTTPESGARLAHQLFEAQALEHPDATAVMYEEESLTYRELNAKANRLAHHLASLGIRPDDRVALFAERGLDMVVGLLAILKSGGAYVPLDPDYPGERLEFMLRDSRPVAVLTQAALRSHLPPLTASLVDLEDTSTQITVARHSTADPNPIDIGLDSQHLAYVIYTSGSTGQPKGVMVEHRHLVSSTLARATTDVSYGRFLLLSSVAFDSSVAGIFGTLTRGGCLIIASRSAAQDPKALSQSIRKHQVTSLLCIPSLAQLIVDCMGRSRPPALQVIIAAGESCPEPLRKAVAAFQPPIALYNEYGPTEATVWATSYRCSPTDEGAVSIGRPVANTTIYLLDARLQPVPTGASGEIYIGGAAVARGYLNRPELTRERFVPDPFASRADARMYKTGDLARYRPDGNLEYLGRNDFQVKVRGVRIELGEIEAQLAACPGVRQAAVAARDASSGEKRLIAYLVPQDGVSLSPAGLRARLASVLAEHMLPAAYVVLDAFPLTPNGKLNRRALPAPEGDAYVRRDYKAPVGEIEATITAIWQELFGIAQIGRHDHFFELGGHSLLAVQFVSRLRQALGIDIPLRELFAAQTVTGLAAAILDGNQQLLHRNLSPIRPQGHLPPLFLVHPIGGEVAYARDLAPWLDAGLPVYGLAASGILEGEEPLRSVEEMAARYIRAVREVQPHGPYHLAGYSAGGSIAYEMAHQLVGADETVAFLGLIDTTYVDGTAATTEPALVEITFLLERCEAGLQRSAMALIIGELRTLADAGNIDAMLARLQETNLIPRDIDTAALRRYLSLYRVIDAALVRYTLPAIPVPLTLFVSLDRGEGSPVAAPQDPDSHEAATLALERSRGWRKLAGDRLRVFPMGGNHLTLLQPPHIQRLGRAMSQALSDARNQMVSYPEHSYSPVVAIGSGHSGVGPLFCVPGAGASVTAFCGLAEVLETAIPLYGLQPRGLEQSLVPHIDVPAAARAYLCALRKICPRGPYRLLGHSFGGWIAFEMAQQLAAAGNQVDAVVILDSQPPMLEEQPKPRITRLAALLKLVELFELSAPRSLGLTAADFTPLDYEKQLALLRKCLIDVKLMPPTTNMQVLRNMVRVFEANSNTTYVPHDVYGGAVHLVWAANDGAKPANPPCEAPTVIDGWRRWAPNVTPWHCPGNHMTMLAAPYVATLAEWLRPLLHRS